LERNTLYEFGRFRFDPANHLLRSEGTPVSLTPKAFEVLLVLVQNGNRLTTKEELMQKVWPDSFVEEANLTVNISALRKLLGETADGRPYIETVPKKGYRFVAPVTEADEETAPEINALGGLVREPLLPPSAESRDIASTVAAQGQLLPRERVWSHFRILGLSLAVAAAISLGYLSYQNRSTRKHSSGQPHRLAVLPFQNLRADTESDFLGFSLADAVITKLGYVSELAVRPSYAVQKYKMQAIDIRRVRAQCRHAANRNVSSRRGRSENHLPVGRNQDRRHTLEGRV
jgi:DNA-binding winged helix-turn-helix (wHTH) protein